jgi:hypothetical protein
MVLDVRVAINTFRGQIVRNIILVPSLPDLELMVGSYPAI